LDELVAVVNERQEETMLELYMGALGMLKGKE